MQAYETALGLLPERSLNWRSLLTSYALQILAVLFLINLGILMPGTLTTLDPSIAIALPYLPATQLIGSP